MEGASVQSLTHAQKNNVSIYMVKFDSVFVDFVMIYFIYK